MSSIETSNVPNNLRLENRTMELGNDKALDEDRPRVIPTELEASGTVKILHLISQDSIDETTSSLASFDITDTHIEDGDPIIAVVIDEIEQPTIVDPIEGHDSEFDVDLSHGSRAQMLTKGLEGSLSDLIDTEQVNDDAEILTTLRNHSSGSIYGKVVKSIQRSIRRIFHGHHNHHKERAKHYDSSIPNDLTASPLYLPSNDIPSMAIQPLISPITSMSPSQSALHQPNGPLPPLHKTLVIDVAYTKPLLSIPRPSDADKKCLILDLDETLVHSTFQPIPNADLVVPVHLGEGIFQPIYVCKRPGVDEFLRNVAGLFEVVIFTASLSNYADPVIDFLDPSGGIKFRLYREDCLQFQGMYIKDLSRLGRDLDQVLIIDNSPASYSMQPNNALGCRSWFKDPHDRELEERLLPMLLRLKDAPSVSHWRNENLLWIETPYTLNNVVE